MSLIEIKTDDSQKNNNIKNKNATIWLADLTYTQQQVSSESMPSAIGGIATYTEQNLCLKKPIRIFKYPEVLIEALETDGIPDIMGFSNYMWNSELSLAFVKRIKEVSPKTIIVVGGPNFPIIASEQELFLRNNPGIDFYVEGEGELAFANLVGILINVDFDKSRIQENLPSIQYIDVNGKPRHANSVDRISDLTEIPSPFLNGKLDEFFDGKLQPIIQTTRGCPFSCTFCTEGSKYFNKVNRYSQEKTNAELEYIAKKMKSTREKGGRNDLWIADSNFGMYTQDLETCEMIGKCQQQYNWPEYIQVDTGKNNKPRVLAGARLVNGAIRLSGSVQTLDKQVLVNIKRSNISENELLDMAQEASVVGADSRSEIILGLPGESLKSHFETLRKVINSRFNHINTYQLMLIPGTELTVPETKKAFKMDSRYRVMPRCFGNYSILGSLQHIADIEEICVATNTLSFDDYVKARKMHLIINIFHNDGIFGSVIKLINHLNLSVFRWLELILEEELEGELKLLFSDYEIETRNELWKEKKDLEAEINNSNIVERYVKGELGYNLLAIYQTRALTKNLDELLTLTKKMLSKLIIEEEKDTKENLKFMNEVLKFDHGRSERLFTDVDYSPRMKFDYNIPKFLENELQPFDACKEPTPLEIQFVLDDDQKQIINRSIAMYGETDVGIGRVLAKVFVTKLLRKPLITNR